MQLWSSQRWESVQTPIYIVVCKYKPLYFVPVTQQDVRQKLASIAIGESLPLSEDNRDDSQDTCFPSAAELLSESWDRIAEKLRNTRVPNLAKAIIKFSRRVTTLTTSTMHSNLTTALFNFESGELKKKLESEKILLFNQTEKESLEMQVARLSQKDGLHNYSSHCKCLPKKPNVVMTWPKLYNQTHRVVKTLDHIPWSPKRDMFRGKGEQETAL